jgi:hypothetical protein
MAKERNFIFQEVSAKTSANINPLFCEIFSKISKKFNLVGSENVEGIQGDNDGGIYYYKISTSLNSPRN